MNIKTNPYITYITYITLLILLILPIYIERENKLVINESFESYIEP